MRMNAHTMEYNRKTTYNEQTSEDIRICTNISSVAINIVTYKFIAHLNFERIDVIRDYFHVQMVVLHFIFRVVWAWWVWETRNDSAARNYPFP